MAKHIIRLGQETDWWYTNNMNLYAQNVATGLFENTSYTEGLVLELYTHTDESEVSDIFNDKRGDCEFVVYNSLHEMIGFAYRNKTEEKPKSYKRVFRFHAHSWTDVIVDSSELDLMGDEDEDTIDEMFFDKASDKYNEGEYDYDSADGNFENTDVEEVTDSLKEDKIYPFNE